VRVGRLARPRSPQLLASGQNVEPDMAYQEDVNTPTVAVVGVVGAVLVFAAIVGLQAWFYNWQEQETYRKVVEPANEELTRLVAEQQVQLNRYHAIDSKTGVYGIPIDRAMDLVVRDLAAAAATQPGRGNEPS
jgi:hypothetical protein